MGREGSHPLLPLLPTYLPTSLPPSRGEIIGWYADGGHLPSLLPQSIYWPENRLSAMYFNTSRQELVTGATRLDLWRPQLQGESTPLPPPELAGAGGDNQRFRRPLVQAVVSQSFRRGRG